jgi:hypothetical protein
MAAVAVVVAEADECADVFVGVNRNKARRLVHKRTIESAAGNGELRKSQDPDLCLVLGRLIVLRLVDVTG